MMQTGEGIRFDEEWLVKLPEKRAVAILELAYLVLKNGHELPIETRLVIHAILHHYPLYKSYLGGYMDS